MTDRRRSRADRIFRAAVSGCAVLSIGTIGAIACYLVASGLPALRQIGVVRFFTGEIWAPDAGRYGILTMLLSSLAASLGAVALAGPFALMGAAFAVCVAPAPLGRMILSSARLLAGLPSVVYGLLGMVVVVPGVASVFPAQTAKNGGATLLAAIVVLAAVVLPTMLLSVAQGLIEAGQRVCGASEALGARPMQTLFGAQFPAARARTRTAAALGTQRAIGEAMAVLLVSGNVPNMPALFSSVRMLSAGMVLEMGYAAGLHRMALFSMGLMLLSLTLLIGGLLRLFGEEMRR